MDFYKDTIDINYFPAFVPWHTISLNKIFKITNDNKYRDALFLFNDKLIKMQNQSGHPYVDFLGRFYDPEHAEYGVPHSASTGVYTEGLCYAYEIAARSNEYERMFEYKKAVFLGAHNLINLQFNGPDMYYIQNPERVEGAIRTSEDNSSIRVDNTQHMIDAFHQILSVFN